MNFFKHLPAAKELLTVRGIWGGVYKGHFFVDLGFVWLRLETPRFMHSKRIHMQTSHQQPSLLFPGFVLQDPTQNDPFYVKPSRSDFDCGSKKRTHSSPTFRSRTRVRD